LSSFVLFWHNLTKVMNYCPRHLGCSHSQIC
jgi:hypothetical protein